jgi:hypothetical protein
MTRLTALLQPIDHDNSPVDYADRWRTTVLTWSQQGYYLLIVDQLTHPEQTI